MIVQIYSQLLFNEPIESETQKMIKRTQITNLNLFEKIETFETGEFGAILRIEEKSTGNLFVAKIFNNTYENKSNIKREIEILQLDHPSISKLYGFSPFDFDNNRRPVIITNFYSNCTLRQVLDLRRSTENLPAWSSTKKLINIYGIASAMSFLHSHQIMHRELSPSSIIEDDHLFPQITKFHFFQNSDDKNPLELLSHNIKNIYMAPELFDNKSYTFASDVYSFSLIVYEILTNKVPYSKLKAMEIFIKVAKQGYRPDITNQNIPEFFQKLLTDCWSQDPNNRPTFDHIIELLKNKENLANLEIDLDENEYFNYVNYIDDYLQNPNLDKSFNFSEQSFQKVSLFKEVEREPLSLNIKLTDLSVFKQFERIGEGTFGTVYEVISFETGKKYACKVLKSKFYKNMENDEKINKLKNELIILMNMKHPAIIEFIGYNSIDFKNLLNPVILTELAANRSLESILQLQRNGLANDIWTDTKKLINIYGIASSMSYLHSLNILHRNLKPSNILLDELIHPKLSDFGFAKSIDDKDTDNNMSPKCLLGTYPYISPEIYENQEYSKASDVYAFSLIVYEILTSQKPFFGSTFYEIMMNVTKGHRPEIKDDLPNCFKKLIQDCWSQDPSKRPSFDDILKKLRNDKEFISENVNKDEFFDYVHKIDKRQSNFEHKLLQIIDYEAIYQKQKVVLITDGVLNLNNFKKKERISKDSYSVKYRVIEKGRNIVYSAKESNIEISNLCKEEIENLKKDVNILSSMNHPYILKFIGYSSVNFDNIHKPVIITEYVSNKTLGDFIEMERDGIKIDGWNDTKKLINIFGIAYCMSFLHSHDILHYNLKPSNIIIDENYHPKLCGFGLYEQNLKKRCLEMQSIDDPKLNFGYSIPEVLQNGKFTKESDVYSFALLVYELITNEQTFSKSDDPIQLLKEIENGSYRPKFNSDIPDCYKELIEACWSQDPQKRPSFSGIVSMLKKDSRFITDKIDKDEFLEFANREYVEPENYNLQQLMNQADNNDPKALFRFGLLYSKGIAMPLNKKKAARFYQKSAELGYAPAKCNLGKMYLRGYGIQQDKQKALELFEQAASQGDVKALFNIGVMYYKGNGVEQSYDKAIEYYEKAAKLNDSEAQFNLGHLFLNGEGVPVDKKRAFDLFQKSARFGNPIAQFTLGVMYQNGVDELIEKDVNKCIQMYKKASDKGYEQAQFNLALLYLNGDQDGGIQVNKEKAMQLFECAAKQGNEEAMLYLDSLVSKSGNKMAFELEKICKNFETKIESLHNSLFTSFYNDVMSTLTYIDNIFIEDILSQFVSTYMHVNNGLKKLNNEANEFLSSKSSTSALMQANSESVDPMNEQINELNKLKFDVQTLEKKLNRINEQIYKSKYHNYSSFSYSFGSQKKFFDDI